MEFHDKIILHPTDFSDNAAKALKSAAELLVLPDSRLMLLHISEYPTFKGNHSVEELEQKVIETRKEASIKMDEYLKKCFGNELPIPVPERDIEMNAAVYKGILDVIDRIGPYMVVIGQKGLASIPNALMGNTTKHLIEKASCPILVAPEREAEL